ncbi:hypothetical protein HY469_04360 [Candidatus Roizmanbacteria bacterium]|nr:hypothetical protein [Candidatus Roizmanbacteria bacterium]
MACENVVNCPKNCPLLKIEELEWDQWKLYEMSESTDDSETIGQLWNISQNMRDEIRELYGLLSSSTCLQLVQRYDELDTLLMNAEEVKRLERLRDIRTDLQFMQIYANLSDLLVSKPLVADFR